MAANQSLHAIYLGSTAATIAFGALLASATAQADILNGARKQAGNHCFTLATGQGRDERFGVWGACPQTASAAAAPASQQIRRRYSLR